MQRFLKRLIFILVIILASCQSVTYQSAPTKISQTPTIDPVSNEKTSTPIVITPAISGQSLQDELKTIWQPALSSGLILYTVCPMMLDTADRQQAALISDETAFGELFTEGLVLSGVEAAFTEWNPDDPQVIRYKQGLQNHLAALLALMKQWSEQEITAADARKDLETQCLHVETYLGNLVNSVQQAGMTQDTLDQILMEFQDDMSEMKITE